MERYFYYTKVSLKGVFFFIMKTYICVYLLYQRKWNALVPFIDGYLSVEIPNHYVTEKNPQLYKLILLILIHFVGMRISVHEFSNKDVLFYIVVIIRFNRLYTSF